MPHDTPLISMIVIGLVLAFIFGAIANRLKLSPLVGYLLAGVAVGPATPGFNADMELAQQLAEIGVILLMFGVGLHFSLRELLSVKAIAIPGALVQIAVATAMGAGLGWLMGWPPAGMLVFGLALSVASTVVLLRALQERRILDTTRGHIAVGWLIVEDLAMVLALVLLPPIGSLLGTADGGASMSLQEIATTLGLTLGKVAAFVAIMLIVGRRVIPRLLDIMAASGSRELFRLAVLAIALGVAWGAATLFGVSFALGAFFAGMVLSESELSQDAAAETLPLRDAFAVLFFVSVGMLFDPSIIVREPLPLLATVLIIVFGKSFAAYGIVRLFGHSNATALTISASLAQIGEFSFILAALGGQLGFLPDTGRDLILAGAILSILFNPFAFTLLDVVRKRMEPAAGTSAAPISPGEAIADTELANHAIVVGYGRVGRLVAETLRKTAKPFLVIEDSDVLAKEARAKGDEVFLGNAVQDGILDSAGIARASSLFLAIPNCFEAAHIGDRARELNPGIIIVGRAHSDAEVQHLADHGITDVIMGEREIAQGMLDIVGTHEAEKKAGEPRPDEPGSAEPTASVNEEPEPREATGAPDQAPPVSAA
ncbi:YbaL family putative K(+) efflux transporter [Segnochrobactrum spirostomi]|uniref:Kef family K(+) transporter n=1 Tax=Segnochrobactrum spirostomi TaxID=2608987 RepID=A0A6A7XY41_9HYPH|nr:YbaL family putative K(+) efflux transporter [Segnochrobactrum spirostomi]MQT11624.1 Kef family K(+) transporter [Segnochrobactrum spirostomi]